MNDSTISEKCHMKSPAGGWWSLCAACLVLWGIWGFLSKLLADRVGAIDSQLLYTAGMLPAALGAIVGIPARELFKSTRGIAYGLLNGLLTGAGTLCFFQALSEGPASVVTPMIAVFPLVTVALAIAFLKERLSWWQAAGALCAVLGMAMLA
jgi:bacterial/archaeal transporter family protein